MAKRVRLSDDNGSNWYTLPGNSGSLRNEAGEIDDTIFGQDFESTQTGLIGAMIEANGLYKGFAGYVAKILKSGSASAYSNEPMQLVSGKTYEVTDTAKRVFDRTSTLVFEDNGSPVAGSNIDNIDHLFGRVTFTSGYTPTTPITVASGSYLPLTQVGRGTSFNLTQTARMIDDTDFETAQGNSGHREYIYGLKTVQLDIGGIFASANGYRALLDARSELVVEINPDGNSKSVARGFMKLINQGQQGDVGDQEVENVSFRLSVPDQADVVTPFKWLHASDTTLNQALQIALTSWEAGSIIDAQYLYDGTNGVAADALISDISLAGGLEVMNDFTVNTQLSGTLTAVP